MTKNGGSGGWQRDDAEAALSPHACLRAGPRSTRSVGDPRHPAVYQRTRDVGAGIYWINTSRSLAEKIINEYSADSTRWREYLFQRYVDIISKEAVYQLGKMSTTLTADDVIRQLDDVTTRVHDQAAKDLSSFLFQETLNAVTS